jgi:hypothetical protein
MCFGLQDMSELEHAEAFASDARLNQRRNYTEEIHYRIPLRWLVDQYLI